MSRPLGTWLLAGAGVAVAASIVAAIATIGTPARQRMLRLDERRVHDITQLQSAIEGHFEIEGGLPASLDALARSRAWAAREFRDPDTGEAYGYRILDARRYQLCATFAAPTPQPQRRWAAELVHPAGRHCVTHVVKATPRARAE